MVSTWGSDGQDLGEQPYKTCFLSDGPNGYSVGINIEGDWHEDLYETPEARDAAVDGYALWDRRNERPSLYDVRSADAIEEEDGVYDVLIVFSLEDPNNSDDRIHVAQQALRDTFPFLPAPTGDVGDASGMERAEFSVSYLLTIDQLRQLSQFVEIEEMADIEEAVVAGTPYIPDSDTSSVADYLDDHPLARAFAESGLKL